MLWKLEPGLCVFQFTVSYSCSPATQRGWWPCRPEHSRSWAAASRVAIKPYYYKDKKRLFGRACQIVSCLLSDVRGPGCGARAPWCLEPKEAERACRGGKEARRAGRVVLAPSPLRPGTLRPGEGGGGDVGPWLEAGV